MNYLLSEKDHDRTSRLLREYEAGRSDVATEKRQVRQAHVLEVTTPSGGIPKRVGTVVQSALCIPATLAESGTANQLVYGAHADAIRVYMTLDTVDAPGDTTTFVALHQAGYYIVLGWVCA